LQFLLVLAVLASAAGNILRDNFGLPYGVGLSIVLVVVGALTFFGRDVIAKVLTFWSFFTNLIASGYGTMAWGFLAIYVIPLLTVGLYRTVTADKPPPTSE